MRTIAALLLLLTSSAFSQELITKQFNVGDLAYIDRPEPCGWLSFTTQVQKERDGSRVYFASKPGTYQIVALSKTQIGEVDAIYTVVIGGPQPIPPDPIPPGPVPPIPPTPTSWTEQVRAWTAALPAAAGVKGPQVAQAFDTVAARIGVDLFTGPDIRNATINEMARVVGTDWVGWNTLRSDADATWAREEFREPSEYKQRWLETAAGIRAAPIARPASVMRSGQCVNGQCRWVVVQ